jgi:hypothetical protein
MKRLFLTALALCALPAAAFAENPETCRAVASVMRDRCSRETGGDIYASRSCQTDYLSELDRCQRLRLQQPVAPILPTQPTPQAPPRIGPPPMQPVQPPTMPRLNR